MSITLAQDAQEIIDWVKKDALPFWINYGFDSRSGSAYDFVAPEGIPDFTGDRLIYKQAMQMYTYASAEHLRWSKGLQDLVMNIGNFVSRWATSECRSDGYMRRLNREFDIVDDRFDITDHAYFMLSSAANYRVYRKYSDQQKATNILEWLDLKFKHPSGGWREGNYQTLYRKQSSHLRLFQAFLTLYEITRSEFWLDQSTRVYELFENHFFEPLLGIVLELYNDDWQPVKSGEERAGETQSVVPEHILEWVWLLERYERHTCVNTEVYSRLLLAWVKKFGRDHQTGLFFGSLRANGQVINKAAPCSAASAYVRASVAEYRRKKHNSEADLQVAIRMLKDWFLFSGRGLLYTDTVEDGQSLIPKWLGSETLFQIMLAAQEVEAAMKIYEKRMPKVS